MKTGYCNCKYNEIVSFQGGGNLVLLKEEEEKVDEETNDDADVNAESNKVDDKNKENHQDQYVGLILIMIGQKKSLGQAKQISIENCIKLNLGVMIQKFQIFRVPISNAKIPRKLQFHPAASVIKYHQKTSNSCCLSILASEFHCIDDNRNLSTLANSI